MTVKWWRIGKVMKVNSHVQFQVSCMGQSCQPLMARCTRYNIMRWILSVTCSPDSSINTTEILLKVASNIRLLFDYIYLLFAPLTLQIMAAEYTSACDTNHLQLFPRSWILWEVVISKCLFLGFVLLFIVFIQIVLLLKDCLRHVYAAFDVLTAFFFI